MECQKGEQGESLLLPIKVHTLEAILRHKVPKRGNESSSTA